jgi:hypothetical protein
MPPLEIESLFSIGSRRMTMRVLVMSLVVQVLAVVLPLSPWAQPLKLGIELSSPRCVVGEPLKLRATMTNVSSEAVGVIEVGYIDRTMEYFYMEVTTPNGDVEQRTSSHLHKVEVTNPSYPGEPLPPGESIVAFFYPVYSSTRMRDGRSSTDPFTFPEPGLYRVSLVYDVSRKYPVLDSETGVVRSNEVTLEVRAPDPVEAEILHELWRADPWPNAPETQVRRADNAAILDGVLKKYPDHELSTHVRLRLAMMRSLTQPEIALDILSELERRDPTFRTEEVAILRARNLGALGRSVEAVELLEGVLARDPGLRSNYAVMWAYLLRRYPGASESPVTQWRINRLNGVSRPEETIRVE